MDQHYSQEDSFNMGVLDFNTNNLITGVNIIDNNLYWTDNRSEPKKLEIDRFRDYDHDGPSTRTGDNYVIESDLSVIRLHPWKPITLSTTEYTVTDTQPEPPFESIFPRFSYRWRYEDGQYSPYAPFTRAAFIPKNRLLDNDGVAQDASVVQEENYTEGFNTTLFNNVGTIVLNDIPRGPRDVVAIDLLYTESISSTVYILETIDIPEAQRGFDYILSGSYSSGEPMVENGDYALLPLSYSLSARKVYRALPANQLLRPYDEVPQRALAQEITANRLVYGNYRIGFDQPDALQITSGFIPYVDLDENGVQRRDGLHVKGNRTYEIGVAYIDAYGRQGSMVTAGSITAPNGDVTPQIPLQSDFSQTDRQQISVTITSDPPTWADRYRYFIKDPSMDHHNLISYNIYNDGSTQDTDSEFVWIEFQSTDRNKVFDESSALDGGTATVLVLRRENDNIQTTKQRFLVQDIENEAPDDVRRQLSETLTNIRVTSQGEATDNVSTLSGTNLAFFSGGDGTATVNQFQNGIVDRFNRFTRAFQADDTAEEQPTDIKVNRMLANIQEEEVDATLLSGRLFIRLRDGRNYVGGEDTYVEVLAYGNSTSLSGVVNKRNYFGLTLGRRYNFTEDDGLEDTGDTGFPAGVTVGNNYTVELFTDQTSEEAIERLGGRFWVRTARNGLATQQSEFTFEGELVNLNQLWFETEPAVDASNLDLFWGTSDTFCVCTQHGWPNNIEWFNSIAETTTNGVYLESTRINDKFNTVQLVRGVMANTPTDRNAVIDRPYGLTWSGIYNSRTSVNRLNQFITEDGITKELEPNYGSLQKLHTRDTNVIAFCEDKVFNILADKDLLFNADGGGNVSAANVVLGQTTPYIGEYGIGKSPESFSTYGYRAWFADPVRGVIIEFIPSTGGQAQMREISANGMSDFFRDRLFSADRIYGMFDDYSDKYIVSVQGYDQNDVIIDPLDALPDESDEVTVGYELDVQGWPSRYSFIPESGLSLNNKFYTWKNGQLYMHNSNTSDRNNFYGTQYNSEVELVFNDDPSSVKEFLTINYEGTNDWNIVKIDTESEDAVINSTWPFVTKEGKHFTPIVSTENIYGFEDQNLGEATSDDGQTVYIQGTQDKSGIKGFYNVTRLRSESTAKSELFSVATENFTSSR